VPFLVESDIIFSLPNAPRNGKDQTAEKKLDRKSGGASLQ
jgi:hypothetical protein